MDSSSMMIGCPVTVERDSFPSWPDMKYPAKKVERIRSTDASLDAFSSSRLSAPSRSSSSSSIYSERPTRVEVSATSSKTRQFSQTRNTVDDTLTSSYLSASGNDSSADLLCPPTMATSPLSQHNDDEMSPLQQCIATFAEQDREYNPPFKFPASMSLDLESEGHTPRNKCRPRRNRNNARSSLTCSTISTYPSYEEMSTPFASNPSSCSSAVSTLSSASTTSRPSAHRNNFTGTGYELNESEINQVLELSAQQDSLDIEDDVDDILTPVATRVKKGASEESDGTPKTRATKFTSSSTRYINYSSSNRTVSTEEIDQLIGNIASARLSPIYLQGREPTSPLLPSLDFDIDTITTPRVITGRRRSTTSASAPPSLPTVVETEERTLSHSCDDFASSVTSLENNVSTCSSRCSIHEFQYESPLNIARPPYPANGGTSKFGRGRSFSESLAETFKKRGEGVAKSARYQWFYITLHMRLRAFQAKKLMKNTSLKQLLGRRISKTEEGQDQLSS